MPVISKVLLSFMDETNMCTIIAQCFISNASFEIDRIDKIAVKLSQISRKKFS